MVTFEDAPYHVTIQNDSLAGVFVLVTENGRIRPDLVMRQFFKGPLGNTPQLTTFDLDATGTVFEVTFIPLGGIDTSANVIIQKQ